MTDKIEVTRADWEYLRALMNPPPFCHNDQAWKVKAQLLFNHFGARHRQLGREEGARMMQEAAAKLVAENLPPARSATARDAGSRSRSSKPHCESEPPITMQERHEAAWKLKQELKR